MRAAAAADATAQRPRGVLPVRGGGSSVHHRRGATAVARSSNTRRLQPSVERQQHTREGASSARGDAAAAAARRSSVKLPQLLTNAIAAAASLEQLHAVVAEHGGRLDARHVAQLLSRTCQLAQAQPPAEPAEQQQTAPQQQQRHHHTLQLLHSSLAAMMAQRARHAAADTLTAAAAALGRLSGGEAAAAGGGRDGVEQQQLQALAARALDLRSELSVSQAAVTCWGLAKAGLQPQPGWVDGMLAAFLEQYDAAAQQQQQVVQLQGQHQQQAPARSAALLQRPTLPAAAAAAAQRAPQPQQQARRALPRNHSLATDLALVMFATSVLGQAPQQQLVQQWQAAALSQLPAANMQDVGQMLWGLSVMGVNPGGSQWLAKVLAASVDLLEGCGSQALANTVCAVERLVQQQQQQLPAEWLHSFLGALCAEPAMRSDPQALSCALAALAHLSKRLPVSAADSARLAGLLEQSVDSLAAATPKQLTDVLWAVAVLSLQPSAAWHKAALTVAARAADAGRCSLQQLATLVWSLALLRGTSSSAPLLMSQQLQVLVLLQAIAAAQQGQGLRALGPGGRSSLAWALASLGVTPDKAWLDAFLTAAFSDGLAADQLRCASVLFCLGSTGFDQVVDWLARYLEGDAIDLSLQKYAGLAGVLAALGDMDAKALRSAWLEQTIDPSWMAAAEGVLSPAGAMPLPPALAAWVDGLAEPAAAAGAGAGDR